MFGTPALIMTMLCLIYSAIDSTCANTSSMREICITEGIIREEHTFQLAGAEEADIDFTDIASTMKETTEKARSLRMKLMSALADRRPTEGKAQISDAIKSKGEAIPPQYA